MNAPTVRLEVGAPAHGGHCVARHEGRVVFVRHALPGEVVEAVLTDAEADARFWRADAVEVIEASPDRVASPWPEAGPGGVGGAELAHVRREAQLDWKSLVLTESFVRFADREFPGAVEAAPGDAERGGLRYRTRLTATADAEGRAAMTRPRTRDLRAIAAMPLAVEAAEESLLAGGFPAGSVVSVAAPSASPVRVLVDGKPWRKAGVDRRDNAPSAVREEVSVGGETYQYKVGAGAFWQVHVEAPALLVGEVLARVGAAQRVADLYAGAGLFTLPLAATGRDVIAIEADADGARHARRNLHAHPQATVVHGDVRRTLRDGIGECDAVVLDPPRSGAGKFTLEQVATTAADTIVYVACDPVALARDTGYLRGLGYDLDDAVAYDLFPMTHHVEAIATFRRR